ncbi:helix-turn-helix domain-containing protein [Sinorhizobium medicae]|nr:helix-turn-helix domain-containing protein [Sinorhizobium medicae]
MNPTKLGVHIEEAVDISGVGRTSLYAAIKEGRLKARKSGRRTIILIDDLKKFLGGLPEKENASENSTEEIGRDEENPLNTCPGTSGPVLPQARAPPTIDRNT